MQNSPDEIRAMNDECLPPKRRGGIMLPAGNWGPAEAAAMIASGNFNFNFECICANEAGIPLPAGLLSSAIRKLATNKAPKWILQMLKKLRGPALDKARAYAISRARIALSQATKKASDYLDRVVSQHEKVRQLKLQLKNSDQLLKQSNIQLKLAMEKIKSYSLAYEKNCRTSHPKEFPLNPKLCSQIQAKLKKWRGEHSKAMQADSELRGLETRLAGANEELQRRSRKYAQLMSDRYQKEQDLLAAQMTFNSGELYDQVINNLPPATQATLLESLLDSLIYLLESLTLVQEKNCMSNVTGLPDGLTGASLNPDTCECSECGGRKLCDLNDVWIEALPTTPGSRMSDEYNVCMECCSDAEPKPRHWSGGIIGSVVQEFGIPPCSCECPETSADGYSMEWVQCDSEDSCERGTFSSSKWACRRKEYHYNGTNYEWDPQACDYVCKNPCPNDADPGRCCSSEECCQNGSCASCDTGTGESGTEESGTEESGTGESGTGEPGTEEPGCCCADNGTEEQCRGGILEDQCNQELSGTAFTISCDDGCSYSWTQGSCPAEGSVDATVCPPSEPDC